MTRTGKARGISRGAWMLALPLLLASTTAQAVEFYQTVDRKEVGTEDTFVLSIVVSDAPADAQLQFPNTADFEVLQRSQSNQFSYNMSMGAGGVKRVTKYMLVMRANRTGALTIPPSILKTSSETLKTDELKITVKKGTVEDPNAARQRQALQDPFSNFPGFGGFPDDEEEEPFPDSAIPRSDSDLFLKATISPQEVFVGEQVTYSIYIYSRWDLSSVDSVIMPKLEGFWSEDLESPTQLASERKIINGVPYHVYMLRRRALFPMHPGTLTIEPAKSDISTGYFDARKYTRKTAELELKVKPLPPGAPPGMSAANVGKWRLFTDVSSTQVALGQPVTVKVTLEGKGNLKNVTPPKLTAPPGVKVYDPTVTDRMSNSRTKVSGSRTHEYLVLPSQTGTFTLPSLSFPYFDPESGQYDVSKTDPITITVTPSANGQSNAGNTMQQGTDSLARNVLSAGGIRPPHVASSLKPASKALFDKPWFIPLAAAPAGLFAISLLVTALKNRQTTLDEGTLKKRKARDARKRLAEAEKLKASGKPDAFYGEVEKALLTFLEAKLGTPVQGLTRVQLQSTLRANNVPEERIGKVVSVLDACDLGRFAPGAAGHSRDDVLDQAEAAMEGWA